MGISCGGSLDVFINRSMYRYRPSHIALFISRLLMGSLTYISMEDTVKLKSRGNYWADLSATNVRQPLYIAFTVPKEGMRSCWRGKELVSAAMPLLIKSQTSFSAPKRKVIFPFWSLLKCFSVSQNPQYTSPATYVIYAHLLRQIAALAEADHHFLMHWFKKWVRRCTREQLTMEKSRSFCFK